MIPIDRRRSFYYRWLVLAAIFTGLGYSGCSRATSGGNSYQREMSAAQRNTARDIPEYRLGFGDVIEVKFFNNNQFNETITVRPDGRITMEKVGDIFVTGMTPSLLDSLITVTYAGIIRDPEVTVFVRKFGSYQAYVLGEVEKPGGYSVERNMTIVQALAVAGGVKYTAALSSVMVLRQGKNEEVNALKVDVEGYLDGEGLHIYLEDKDLEVSLHDFLIQPQDIIYIPKTGFSSTVAFLEQVYAGFLPPIDVYLRALLWSRY